jgi:hypothetical protein
VNYPSKFWVLGSNDGINWALVDSRSNLVWSSSVAQTFSVSMSQSFQIYRIVFNICNGSVGTQPAIYEWTLNGYIESVNVTADGRVGLGVVAPTRALEVAGDIVCTGTVSSQSTTFRNVLYNGDFRINQRGISTTVGSPSAIGTTATTAYTLDRWLCYRGSFATQGYVAQGTMTSVDLPYQNDGLVNFMRIGRNAGDTSTQTIYTWNALESRDSYRLAGKYVTLSCYYRTGAALAGTLYAQVATSTGTNQNASTVWAGPAYQTYTLSASSSWTKVSFSAHVPASATQVAATLYYNPTTAMAVANDYFDITGVQLEKGTMATPFEVRPYATELALCQRYYQVFGPGNTTGYNRFGAGTLNLAYQGVFAIPLQVSMRAAPTVFSNSAVSTFSVSSGGASQPVTVLGFADASYTSFSCAATTGVNVNTQGFGCLLIGNNSTSAFIGVSAEL